MRCESAQTFWESELRHASGFEACCAGWTRFIDRKGTIDCYSNFCSWQERVRYITAFATLQHSLRKSHQWTEFTAAVTKLTSVNSGVFSQNTRSWCFFRYLSWREQNLYWELKIFCLFLLYIWWRTTMERQGSDLGPGAKWIQMFACSQGGVTLYSSCFPLFKSSVTFFYFLFNFSWQSPCSLFSCFILFLCVTLLERKKKIFKIQG